MFKVAKGKGKDLRDSDNPKAYELLFDGLNRINLSNLVPTRMPIA